MDKPTAGQRVVLILDGGRVVSATITQVEISYETRETTWDDPDTAPTYRTHEPTGRHTTTMTLDVDL